MLLGTKEERIEKVIELFDWMEYTVFGASLLACMLIGVWFGFIKKAGQDTVEGYMLGGKQMKLFPVSLSLISSFISGITLLGVPAEVYDFGILIMGAAVGMLINGIISAVFYVPVFYDLQLLSLYEYLELRFNRSVRKTASGLYIFTTLIWVALAVYVPALAMNLVTGLNVHAVTSIASLVCIFYTTVGGLKAVVWTDTLQSILMVGSLIVVMIAGTFHVGGLSKVLEVSAEGGRLEFFNKMNIGLTDRMTIWSSIFGYSVFWIYATSNSSAMVQRFLSLPTKRLALQSLFWYVVGCVFFFSSACYIGLAMYTMYKDCDPITAGLARKPEQVTPMFVLEAVGHIKGIPGLFLSGVFAAALSTMATAINAVAAIIYEDFIVALLKKRPQDKVASRYMKWTSLIIGIITVSLVFLVEKLGAVVVISSMFGGAVAGIMVGLFTLGILAPFANVTGAFWGFGVSAVYMAWTIIGFNYYNQSGVIKYKKLDFSTKECPFNVTSAAEVWENQMKEEDVFPVYRLSIFWYSVVSFIMTMVIGIVVSKLTGGRESTVAEKKLFHPFVHKYLIKKDDIKLGDVNGYVEVPVQDPKA
uniref:Sodium-coupled monocarboxylate transporter 2 n=1 Tax=Lygus hesperus TaxID=30085 RepID=A0A146LI51_LYGHE